MVLVVHLSDVMGGMVRKLFSVVPQHAVHAFAIHSLDVVSSMMVDVDFLAAIA